MRVADSLEFPGSVDLSAELLMLLLQKGFAEEQTHEIMIFQVPMYHNQRVLTTAVSVVIVASYRLSNAQIEIEGIRNVSC